MQRLSLVLSLVLFAGCGGREAQNTGAAAAPTTTRAAPATTPDAQQRAPRPPAIVEPEW